MQNLVEAQDEINQQQQQLVRFKPSFKLEFDLNKLKKNLKRRKQKRKKENTTKMKLI